MKQSEFLTKVEEVLSSEEKWTQHACAKDRNGTWVGVTDPNAVCFCLYGAGVKVAEEYKLSLVNYVDRTLALLKGDFPTTPKFNDGSTYEQVKARIAEVKTKLISVGL